MLKHVEIIPSIVISTLKEELGTRSLIKSVSIVVEGDQYRMISSAFETCKKKCQNYGNFALLNIINVCFQNQYILPYQI